MAGDSVSVSFNCGKCGTKIVWSDDAVESTPLDCSNCGEHVGTYGDIKDAAMKAVKSKVENMFKDTFKKFK